VNQILAGLVLVFVFDRKGLIYCAPMSSLSAVKYASGSSVVQSSNFSLEPYQPAT
jgi:hypothetical protein